MRKNSITIAASNTDTLENFSMVTGITSRLPWGAKPISPAFSLPVRADNEFIGVATDEFARFYTERQGIILNIVFFLQQFLK